MNASDADNRLGPKARSRRIVERHYHERGWKGPFRRYEELLATKLTTPGRKILDVGCGRTFPMAKYLQSYKAEVFGIDPVVTPEDLPAGVEVRQAGAESIPFDDGTFDVVACCSVLEHLQDPLAVFSEFHRVLKSQGTFVFLAPNRYDYVSVFASLIPNRWHKQLVKHLEGRDTDDTFDTYYRANSRKQIARLAEQVGLQIEHLDYLNQFPAMLMRWPWVCRLGIAYDDFIGRHSKLHWLRSWLIGSLVKT